MSENGDSMHEPIDAVPSGELPGGTAPDTAVPAWGTGFNGFHAPQASPYAPVQGPSARMSGGARNALIAGATTAGVAAVVLLIVFTGHRGSDSPRTFTVPAMTFTVRATIAIPLDGRTDPGCAIAEDALTTATDDFGKDIGNPTASAADAQKAIDQAVNAATAARSTELKSAVDTMKTHLIALHTAAVANDLGSEASTLDSMQGDITAVFGACTP